MKLKFLLAGMLAMLFSCKKDSNVQPIQKSVIQLLTQKEWILKAVGFDDNKNDILDEQENVIADCQKDNSFHFNTNGSGKALDNAQHCGTPVNTEFNWALSGNDKVLEIGPSTMHISTLNETDMVLIPDIPGLTVNYMLIYVR